MTRAVAIISGMYETGIDLWNRWTRMWNEDPELALELVADRFTVHLTIATTLPPAAIDGPAAVMRWVTTHRATFQRLRFHTGCGPFVDERAGIVAGPWSAETSIDGTDRPVCGMDTLAFERGKITEYWTISRPVDAVGDWTVHVGRGGR